MKSELFLCTAGFAAIIGSAVLFARTERNIGGFSTSLAGRTAAQRHNAVLAATRLNGAIIGAGAIFSFNRRVGTFSRDAGYERAPVSFNGDLIKDWGGGVCQTSTTLYNSALLAGCEIVERHHHRYSPSYVTAGRDAAVAFPGVDLRFRNVLSTPIRIVSRVEGDTMIVDFLSTDGPKEKCEIVTRVDSVRHPNTFHVSLSEASQGVRASGRDGFDVSTYRMTGSKRERISADSYPSMDRVIGVTR